MNYLGIDLGTTSISAAVLDENGGVLRVENVPCDRFLLSAQPWERVQDVDMTLGIVGAVLSELLFEYAPIGGIGVTGQMHGILYVGEDGIALSPLYTWQDGRAGLDAGDGISYAEHLVQETGCKSAPGFGLATHRYNLAHGLVPDGAAYITTIGSYVAMRLAGKKVPVLHASDADSLGGYLTGEGHFAVSDALLPKVVRGAHVVGQTGEGIPVLASVGDNQASFFGSVNNADGVVLVNVGTGSQVSVRSKNYVRDSEFECRPYMDDDYLLVGCPLCGGRAYALLENFMRECALLAGAEPDSMYEVMNRLADVHLNDAPVVSPLFSGTRTEPGATASIARLTADNFTPAHIVCGMVEGMAQELYGYYAGMRKHIPAGTVLIGSGAGVERNAALRKRIEAAFGLPMKVSDCNEAAACGAARLAAIANGK